jgi:hypothetical protein
MTWVVSLVYVAMSRALFVSDLNLFGNVTPGSNEVFVSEVDVLQIKIWSRVHNCGLLDRLSLASDFLRI